VFGVPAHYVSQDYLSTKGSQQQKIAYNIFLNFFLQNNSQNRINLEVKNRISYIPSI